MSDELFEKYKKLAFKKAYRFAVLYPHLTEDFRNAAVLGLLIGIEKAKGHPNPVAVISLWIKNELYKCLEFSICPVRIPRCRIRKEKQKGGDIKDILPKIVSSGSLVGIEDWRCLNDLEDHLTPLEINIVIWRICGYTYSEIAERFGKSKPWVQKIVKGIREKWRSSI